MPNVNQILREKTVPQMSEFELGLVMDTAKNALFERSITTRTVDDRKRAMGKWALDIYKNPEVGFLLKNKVKQKYVKDISYYLKNKKLPEPDARSQEMIDLLNDIEYERMCRKVILTLDNGSK